ncbi:MAG: metallophosphoesterase [Anaerolineae bacterium]
MANQIKTLRLNPFLPPADTFPQTSAQEDWLFRLMMFFQQAAAWPAWKTAGSLLAGAGLTFSLWQMAAPGTGAAAALGLLVFALADWLLLAWLPRAGRSYGPVAPQLMIMLIPRLLVAGGGATLAHLAGPAWGLMAFIGLELAGSLAYVWGLAVEPQRLSLNEIRLTSPHLPAGAKPIRLLHLSDLHLERLTRREERLLELVEAARPDLIAITGDYLNASYRRDPEAISQVRQLLSRLKAPYGVYAVLGTPVIDVEDVAPHHFNGSGIRLLRRDVLDLDLGQGRRLSLLGLDCSHDPPQDERALGQLARVTLEDAPRVLLYHSPELMPVAPRNGVDLYLCGHTHGGQVRLPGYGALFTSATTGKRYEMGRYDEGGTTLYVSRGLGLEGFSMPRLRLFCPPEITLVTIERR